MSSRLVIAYDNILKRSVEALVREDAHIDISQLLAKPGRHNWRIVVIPEDEMSSTLRQDVKEAAEELCAEDATNSFDARLMNLERTCAKYRRAQSYEQAARSGAEPRV